MKKKHFFIIIFLFLIYIYLLNLSIIPNSFFAINNGKIKEIAAVPYPKVKVIPAGNLIGLKLYTNGVLVIGTSEIKGIDGIIQKPFENTNIQEGDIIIELDNIKIDSSGILKSIINNSEGRELEIKYIKRGEERLETIKPVQTNENEYKLGIWVRDSASGVGTMAFFEPESKKFVALGHGISDNDTGELLDIERGEAVNSKIINITKGKNGFPGEIKGSISKEKTIGTVYANTNVGIYGTLIDEINYLDKYKDGIEVASREEIHLGKAVMLTTLETGVVKEYEIEIIAIDIENTDSNKNMQVKITDEEIIKKTGGIICGMSGSPIIQDNKLIGSLTNVLVSDPKQGYAIFADTMVMEMVK